MLKNTETDLGVKVAIFGPGGKYLRTEMMRARYSGQMQDAVTAVNRYLDSVFRHLKGTQCRVSLHEVLKWDKELQAWADITLDVIDGMLPPGCP